MSSILTNNPAASQAATCQGCGSSQLKELLDLGYQPLCNLFLPSDQAPRPQTFYPLCLCYCPNCTLVQLNYIIPTAEAFGEQYTYLTGSSRSLIDYYSKLASKLVDIFGLAPGDVVIEIGSNDGTFLKALQSHGLRVLGIEGATVSADLANQNGIPTLTQFFGKGIAATIKEQLPEGGRVRLVIGMNVLAHTDNINEFLPEVAALMDTDTVFVSQSHWLVSLVRKLEFDTIYHEHLRYYTLGSLTRLLDRHGLVVFDAEITDFYGGSILVYATKNSANQSPALKAVLQQEEETDIVKSLENMKTELMKNKARLLGLLVDLKSSGKRVVGIGAPMKASTLLNFYGVTGGLIEYLAEVNDLKVGTLVPGVRIPVLHEDIVFQEPPDYAVLMSWNMADVIVPKYRSMGYKGKFILPVPEVQVME